MPYTESLALSCGTRLALWYVRQAGPPALHQSNKDTVKHRLSSQHCPQLSQASKCVTFACSAEQPHVPPEQQCLPAALAPLEQNPPAGPGPAAHPFAAVVWAQST